MSRQLHCRDVCKISLWSVEHVGAWLTLSLGPQQGWWHGAHIEDLYELILVQAHLLCESHGLRQTRQPRPHHHVDDQLHLDTVTRLTCDNDDNKIMMV